jgi:ABC-2 type transport system ATP-binding protein
MNAILEVENVSKTYRKAKRPALDDLSFTVDQGSIYAFVGPNGAGKTTIIRIIATLLRFDEGQVRVGGYDVTKQQNKVCRILGYIPDEFGMYGEMLVREYLDFFAGCFGIEPATRPSLIEDLLDLVGLNHRREDEVRSLSRGMRQRLGLARALVHDPQLIVADEPAAGLDPRARVELREIFRVLQEMGKTIFLSSHVLRELDEIATHIGIVEEGKLVVSGPVTAVRAKLRPHRCVRVRFLAGLDDAQAWLLEHPDVLSVERITQNASIPPEEQLLVTLEGQEPKIVQLLADLVREGFEVRSYTEEEDTLESMFMNLTRGVVS